MATLLWVFFAFKLGCFHETWNDEIVHPLENAAAIVVALILGAVAGITMLMSYTGSKEIWWVCFLAVGVMLFLVFVMVEGESSLSSDMVVFCIAIALLITTVIKLADDNPYNVERGVVISQDFTPAHTVLICSKTCVPMFVPDDWAIQLQACDPSGHCQKGWKHFDGNVFGKYPIGSQYPDDGTS